MTADASEMTPRDRRNQRRYALWMLGWFICLNVTQALFRFRRGLVPPGVITWLVGALPVVVAAFVIWSWARYVREADELQRRIQLNALALGFGVTFFSLASYGALRERWRTQAGGEPLHGSRAVRVWAGPALRQVA